MKRPEHTDLRVLLPIAVALFALSCVVRILLADFPKGIGVLPDEIRYLDLASSLVNAGELIQRGGYSSFQKILYPLSLAPAFLFNDPQVRVQIITILNCLYASSAVFPAMVLARRLFSTKAPVIICMLFTLIMPDMCYSMTFLSECVYLPLALWLIACCLTAFERRGRRQFIWCAGAGLLCYAAYLCKEVALGFALAFLVIMIIKVASAKEERRSTLIALVCFLGGLAVPFIIMKLTLFAGLLNSYNQADPRVLLNPYTVLFTIYAIVSDASHFAIAFAFFPLVFPAFTWSRLSRRERELYLFCLLAFAFILLAVVYTISIREDLGHVGIRPHVRYVAPIFLPLLFLFIKQIARGDGAAIMENPHRFIAAISSVLVMCLLAVFMIGSGDYSQGFDNAQFHILRIIGESAPDIPIDPNADPASSVPEDKIYHGEYLGINAGMWAAKAAIVLYLLLGLWGLLCKHKKRAGIAILVVIAAFMLANNVGAYLYNKSVYEIEQGKVDELCIISDFIDDLPPGEQVLVVYDDGSSSANNSFDVYIDNSRLNCNYIIVDKFKELLREETGSQRDLLIECDATMGDNIFGANGRIANENSGIAYLIVNNTQRIRLTEACARDITPEGVTGYTVYQIEPGADLALAPAFMR